MAIIWEGVCSSDQYQYDTTVEAAPSTIRIDQSNFREGGLDSVIMQRDEAIDVAFSILRECSPTLAEALECAVALSGGVKCDT